MQINDDSTTQVSTKHKVCWSATIKVLFAVIKIN